MHSPVLMEQNALTRRSPVTENPDPTMSIRTMLPAKTVPLPEPDKKDQKASQSRGDKPTTGKREDLPQNPESNCRAKEEPRPHSEGAEQETESQGKEEIKKHGERIGVTDGAPNPGPISESLPSLGFESQIVIGAKELQTESASRQVLSNSDDALDRYAN